MTIAEIILLVIVIILTLWNIILTGGQNNIESWIERQKKSNELPLLQRDVDLNERSINRTQNKLEELSIVTKKLALKTGHKIIYNRPTNGSYDVVKKEEEEENES